MAWQSGVSPGIPGLTSDGSNGIDVVGGAVIDGNFTSGDPLVGTLSTFNGNALIDPPFQPFGAPSLEVDQTAPVASLGSRNQPAMLIVRDNSGGLSMTRPMFSLQLNDPDSVADIIHYFNPLGVGDFRVNRQGGVGMFNAVGGSAPRTLAQSVITAITDTNAKTAVQVLADALADMGALTLT